MMDADDDTADDAPRTPNFSRNRDPRRCPLCNLTFEELPDPVTYFAGFALHFRCAQDPTAALELARLNNPISSQALDGESMRGHMDRLIAVLEKLERQLLDMQRTP